STQSRSVRLLDADEPVADARLFRPLRLFSSSACCGTGRQTCRASWSCFLNGFVADGFACEVIENLELFSPQKFERAEETRRTVKAQNVRGQLRDATTPKFVFAFVLEAPVQIRARTFHDVPAPGVRERVPGDLTAHDVARGRRRLRRGVLRFARSKRWTHGKNFVRVVRKNFKRLQAFHDYRAKSLSQRGEQIFDCFSDFYCFHWRRGGIDGKIFDIFHVAGNGVCGTKCP